MRTVEVTLDGESFTIQELRSRENRAWRQQLEGEFEELVGLLENAPETEITDAEALAGLVRSVSGKLLGSIDIIGELVVAYAPTLETAVADGYDSEIMDAFTKVLGLAYPFGPLMDRLLGIGQRLQRNTAS